MVSQNSGNQQEMPGEANLKSTRHNWRRAGSGDFLICDADSFCAFVPTAGSDRRIVFVLSVYIASSRTIKIDCYRLGAVPRVSPCVGVNLTAPRFQV